MKLSDLLEFKGNWRNYQTRVLQHASGYLVDGKIHIVAAPGSGKTTLGIELMRRINCPALVLAPSVTIREQWVARIEEAFLKEDLKAEDYFSQNLKDPKLITVATYQALHSAMTRFRGTLSENGPEAEDTADEEKNVTETSEIIRKEDVDYSDFDLAETMKAAGVGVLCLDECHHLRSEWWKALEDLKKAFKGLKTIALTATPPYDSTPAMWNRYMDMCGEIDEEITIPELVKEGSLCPHQDFVYFNYPTAEEEKEVRKFQERSREMLTELLADVEFTNSVCTHTCLSGIGDPDALLEKPAYFSALLIFLQEKGIPFPRTLRDLIRVSKLPPMNEKWMQHLLQGFLYDDAKSYTCDKVYLEQLEVKLKRAGLIEKKKVTMEANEEIEKLLMRSKGKSNSIRDIVYAEYEAIGDNLRQLILTDYIRKEYEAALGNPEADIHSLGVLPFFEMLRRENVFRADKGKATPKLGILCGSLVVIPADAEQALLDEIGSNGKVTFSKAGAVSDTEYIKVNAIGDTHFLTGAVTAIFSAGKMQVLIGTKSLLGEGWDSPCINSLIMASFVGSFMLSNQMRGRAIRVFKNHPEKTSNIWHLVCLKPRLRYSGNETQNPLDGDISEDFTLLERRMEHFLGLHYSEDCIENGINRLSIIKAPFNRSNADKMNREMLQLSAKRSLLKERWDKSLAVFDKIEIADETAVSQERIPAVVFYDAIRREMISFLLLIIMACLRISACSAAVYGPIFTLAAIIVCVGMLLGVPRLIALSSPLRRLKKLGKCMLKALQEKNLISTPNVKVETETDHVLFHAVYLKGGTGRDKRVFTESMNQFFDEIDNQRYILRVAKKRRTTNGYYCVPEGLSKRKEDAQLLAECLKPVTGTCNAIYTRNPEGRKILLEARIHALANRENRCITHKKVKNALE